MTARTLPAAEAALMADPAGVDALCAAIAKERELYAPLPVAGPGTEIDWRRVQPGEPFAWDLPRPLSSTKRFFFPPRETLLRWEGDLSIETPPDPAPFALLGLTPCDVTAIAYQDRFFAGDAAYARRRERALVIGVNCLSACEGGFCHNLDAGPFARGGFDLNLTRLPADGVVVEIGSALGRSTLASAGVETEPLGERPRRSFFAALRAAEASFPPRPFIARAIARLNAMGKTGAGVAETEWQSLGRACFACTGCTILCPTCSCFTLVDEVRQTSGERVRVWDSCLLEGFQREASGHHPAPRPGDRVRRFWYHKLSDDYLPRFGRYGCVGCGRCDVTCPGSIGALKVFHALGGTP